MKKSTKNIKKTTKNEKTTKKTDLKGATSHKKQTTKSISSRPTKTAPRQGCEANSQKNIKKTTKDEKTTKKTRRMRKIIRPYRKLDGTQLYEEIRVCRKVPKGWKFDDHSRNAPFGFDWVTNGEPYFAHDKNGKILPKNGHLQRNPKYKEALLEDDWHAKLSEEKQRELHRGSSFILENFYR